MPRMTAGQFTGMKVNGKANMAEATHFIHLALHGPTGINTLMRKNNMSFGAAHSRVMDNRITAGNIAHKKGGHDRAATWQHVVNHLSSLATPQAIGGAVASHNTKTAHRISGFKKVSTFGQNSLKGRPTRNRSTTGVKSAIATPRKSAGSKPTGGHKAMRDMMTTSGRKSLGSKVKRATSKRAKSASTRKATRPKTAKQMGGKKRVGAKPNNRGLASKRGYYTMKVHGKTRRVKYTKKGQGKKRKMGSGTTRRRRK